MPETDLSTVVILIAACVGLLILILIGVMMAGSRLARIERLLAVRREESPAADAPTMRMESLRGRSGGAFERFLDEEPSRKLLSKKEQSAAYRKWRQEQGMNWANS